MNRRTVRRGSQRVRGVWKFRYGAQIILRRRVILRNVFDCLHRIPRISTITFGTAEQRRVNLVGDSSSVVVELLRPNYRIIWPPSFM